MKKRVLSLLLAALMLLSLFPAAMAAEEVTEPDAPAGLGQEEPADTAEPAVEPAPAADGVYDIQVGETEYKDLASALTAAKGTGATVYVNKSVNIEASITVTGVNKLEIASGAAITRTNGNTVFVVGDDEGIVTNLLLLGGGTITNASATGDNALISVKKGATLVLQGPKCVTTNAAGTAVSLEPGDKGTPEVDINGSEVSGGRTGVFVSGGGLLRMEKGTIKGSTYGVVTNGSDDATYRAPQINLYGGDVSGEYGMYLPAVGGVAMIGNPDMAQKVTITGSKTGVEIRAGQLAVYGNATINGGNSYSITENGSGPASSGVGLAVCQHSTDEDITVNVVGGTITGAVAMAIADPENGNFAPKSFAVENGTFNGTTEAVKVEEGVTAAGVIYGGTFSQRLDSKLLAPHRAQVPQEDGTYLVCSEDEAQKDGIVSMVNADGTTTYYPTLYDAVEAAPKGVDKATEITVWKEHMGKGIDVGKDGAKNLSITFIGDASYIVNSLVGSSGYENQAFRVQQGSTVTMRGNGGTELRVGESLNCVMLINNYGTLTLNGMALNGYNLKAASSTGKAYTLSSTCGVVTMSGCVFSAPADHGYAIRCNSWARYPDGTQMTATDCRGLDNVIVESREEGVEPSYLKIGDWAPYYNDVVGGPAIELKYAGYEMDAVLPDATVTYSDVGEGEKSNVMTVEFSEELPENTNLWFEIVDPNRDLYGGVAHKDSGKTKKVSWSLSDPDDFAKKPSSADFPDGNYVVLCFVRAENSTEAVSDPSEVFYAWRQAVEVKKNLTAVTGEPDVVMDNLSSVTGDEKAKVKTAANAIELDAAGNKTLADEAIENASYPEEQAVTEAVTEAVYAGNASELIGKDMSDLAVVVETFMQVTPENYTDAAEGGKKQLTYEIQPKYQLKVVKKDDVGKKLTKTNSAPIGDPQDLQVSGSVKLTLGVPDTVAETGNSVYIRHVKNDNRTYWYSGTVQTVDGTNVVEFTNPHGFSKFTVTADPPTVEAKIGDTSYETLQAAVDDVEDDGEIVIPDEMAGTALSATVSREVTFTVKGGSVTITAGSGYTVTPTTNEDGSITYDVTVAPSGGGYWPTVDKSKLKAAITAAEALNEDDYTADSWAEFETALAAAKAVDAKSGATQTEVNTALSALTTAQGALVKKDEEQKPGPGGEEPSDTHPAPASGTGWSYDKTTGEWYFYKNNKLVADYWVGYSDGASKWTSNWYYVGPDGKMLTGFQYLDDLKGGKAWYMLQTTNDKQEIGKMLTGWQWTYSDKGEGWFSPKYGSQGMCTWNEAWGAYDAATGLWADGLSHKGA